MNLYNGYRQGGYKDSGSNAMITMLKKIGSVLFMVAFLACIVFAIKIFLVDDYASLGNPYNVDGVLIDKTIETHRRKSSYRGRITSGRYSRTSESVEYIYTFCLSNGKIARYSNTLESQYNQMQINKSYALTCMDYDKQVNGIDTLVTSIRK